MQRFLSYAWMILTAHHAHTNIQKVARVKKTFVLRAKIQSPEIPALIMNIQDLTATTPDMKENIPLTWMTDLLEGW